jgi:ankyrin repeat protein
MGYRALSTVGRLLFCICCAAAAASALALTAEDRRERGELLLAACFREDTADALRLVDEQADVSFASETGVTPLMRAAAAGMDAVVQRLLAAGASVGAVNEKGNTAITLACWNGHSSSARLLIDAASAEQLNRLNSESRTALDYAVASEMPQVAAAIHARGGHSSAELRERQAARSEQPATAVRPELSAEDARARGRLLYDAILKGNTADALRAISEGADVDFVGDVAGFSPLILASAEGADEVVARLIEAKAKLDLTDMAHETALMKACSEGTRGRAAALALIAAGANVNIPSRGGETALDMAMRQEGFAPVRAALRAKGALTGAELKAQAEARRAGALEVDL